MAAKPISPSIVSAIVADWRTGEYSQRDLAAKHQVSVGKVASLTKGVEQDAAPIVSAGIQYNQGLNSHDERMVSAITEVVDKTVQRMEWLSEQAIKNVVEAMNLPVESQMDCKSRGDTILKAAEVVRPASPSTAVQINNNAVVQKIERVIV